MRRPIQIGDLVVVSGPHHGPELEGRQALVLDRIHYLDEYYDVPLMMIPEESDRRIPHRDEYSCKIQVLGEYPQVVMMRAKWLKLVSKVKEN